MTDMVRLVNVQMPGELGSTDSVQCLPDYVKLGEQAIALLKESRASGMDLWETKNALQKAIGSDPRIVMALGDLDTGRLVFKDEQMQVVIEIELALSFWRTWRSWSGRRDELRASSSRSRKYEGTAAESSSIERDDLKMFDEQLSQFLTDTLSQLLADGWPSPILLAAIAANGTTVVGRYSGNVVGGRAFETLAEHSPEPFRVPINIIFINSKTGDAVRAVLEREGGDFTVTH